MEDLISRKDAINALGNEPDTWYGDKEERGMIRQWYIDKSAIEGVVSFDIIQCNECKFWEKSENSIGLCKRLGALSWFATEPTDFCSLGQNI